MYKVEHREFKNIRKVKIIAFSEIMFLHLLISPLIPTRRINNYLETSENEQLWAFGNFIGPKRALKIQEPLDCILQDRVVSFSREVSGIGDAYAKLFSLSFFQLDDIASTTTTTTPTTAAASVDGAIYIDGLFSLAARSVPNLFSRSISSRLYPFLAILATTSG